MDKRVTPPKRVTSPTWGPPPPCKQAVSHEFFSEIYVRDRKPLLNVAWWKRYFHRSLILSELKPDYAAA